MAMSLYEDLKQKVEASGFSMGQVCIKAGVSSGTPSHWGSTPPRTTPNQRTYDRLIQAINELSKERAEKMREAGLIS